MKYHLLGRSGLRVSEISLGTMTFGEEWGWGASKEESRKQFELFVERGGNFIDTANRYTEGTSERFVGEFVRPDREKYVVATKYTLSMRKGDVSFSGNSRKNMIQSLDNSLKRLGLEYIDLYWLHAWDFMTPIDEVMRSLDDVVRAGKVLYIGISDTPAWIVSIANTIADLRGWTPFVALQIEYSLLQRAPERDLLPMAKALDLAVTPWGVLGGGALSGKYSRKNNEPGITGRVKPDSSRRNERAMRIAAVVDKVADEVGRPSVQIALNWARQRDQVVIPIIGARTATQLKESLDALDFELNADQMMRLDEVSEIELGFPHDFLKQPPISNLIAGDLSHLIHNHRH
ncbi:MAG: aldo/keto reductase [candidate division Zixibacteria bacterium]|nr:aldo/keto reductase [candidate division Zixibacteria bacterium]